MSRLLSAQQIEIIRRDYRKVPAREIATAIGRNVFSVYNAAFRLGLTECQRIRAPGFEAFLRAKHRLGWSDMEIAECWGGVDRHAVSAMRQRLGLPSVLHSEHQRDNVRRKTAEQLKAAGLPSIGHLRVEAFKRRAREAGWPEDIKPRQVQILNLLWERGPMTREQLGQALGLTKKPRGISRGRQMKPWYPMHCNTPVHGADTSYVADLMRRGMVISLGRIAKHPELKCRGSSTVVYSLPMNISRQGGAQCAPVGGAA